MLLLYTVMKTYNTFTNPNLKKKSLVRCSKHTKKKRMNCVIYKDSSNPIKKAKTVNGIQILIILSNQITQHVELSKYYTRLNFLHIKRGNAHVYLVTQVNAHVLDCFCLPKMYYLTLVSPFPFVLV